MSIKNYKFHVLLTRQPEEIFWQQARAMNDLWNAMVEHRTRFLESVKDLYEDKTANHEELNSRWKEFDHALIEIHRRDEWKEKLGWEAREAVLERFRTASTRALKNGAELRLKSKRLTQISFYHRFTAGGLKTEKLFTGKGKKLALAPVPEEFYLTETHQNRHRRYSKGVFGIGLGDQPLHISVYLHRPVPIGKVKTVQFVGRFDELKKQWSWSLVLSIDTPELEEMPGYKPAAAIDLNWRRQDEFLRIGFIIDTSGNSFEVRLPIFEPLSRRAKNVTRAINGARRAENLPPLEFKELFPRNILEISEWQGRCDHLKDELKNELTKIYEPLQRHLQPEYAKDFLQHFARINRRGLLKLLWQVNEAKIQSPETKCERVQAADRKACQLLEEWNQKDYRLRLSIHQTYKYLTNKRKKLYENLALWLRANYSYLVWESDLSLKRLAEKPHKLSLNSEDIAIKRGNKFRQYAGLSILRGKIKEHNRQDWLIGTKSQNTTRRCHKCGADCETDAHRLIQCSNGHLIDQDANSCSNMLEFLPEEEIYSSAKEAIKIPAHLENFIIPVAVET